MVPTILEIDPSWRDGFLFAYPHRPLNYLVADIETTGFSIYDDFAVHLALLEVVSSRPVACTSVYLDWTTPKSGPPMFTEDSLRYRLNVIKKRAAERGKTIHFDYPRYLREKVDAYVVLRQLYGVLDGAVRGGYSLVGHNFIKFDANMLTNHYEQLFKVGSPFNHLPLIDTGGLEKARQIQLFPEPGEPISKFSRRSANVVRKGVKWDLHEHCVVTYGLHEKTAALVEHDPADDCMKSHYVLETLADALGWRP